jgi:hypothetical protein
LVGALDDLIVYIRIIHNVSNLKTTIFEIPVDDIVDEGRHGMPNVSLTVNGRTTDIHGYFPRLKRYEIFLFVGKGIENPDAH